MYSDPRDYRTRDYERDGRYPRQSGARRNDGYVPRGSTASMRRVEGDPRRTRTRTEARGSRDPRRTSGGGRRVPARPSAPAPLAIPAVVCAIACLVCLVAGALITFLLMRPQVDAAKAEAAQASDRVAALEADVTRLNAELATATPQTTSATTGTSTTSAATGTSTTSAATGATSTSKTTGSTSTSAAKTVGVEDPWVDSGTFTTGDSVLDQEVKQFCDENTSSADTREEAALNMYKKLAWADYVERDDAQEPSGPMWRNTYAHQYFENGNSGNCYEFACALMYCLQYMGYEDAQAEAILIKLQSGSWGDHGIVFVTDTDGRSCMCDTARGVDGWMIDTDTYTYTVEDVESA